MEKIAVPIGNSFLGSGHFLTQLTGVGTLVSLIASNAILIAGVIFIFLLIFGGISMIGGAGAGDPQKVGRGREIVAAAVIGFIIVIAAWWIVLVIGRATGLNLLP